VSCPREAAVGDAGEPPLVERSVRVGAFEEDLLVLLPAVEDDGDPADGSEPDDLPPAGCWVVGADAGADPAAGLAGERVGQDILDDPPVEHPGERPLPWLAVDAFGRISEWAARLGVRPAIRDGGIAFEHPGGLAGGVLAIVLTAAADGRWRRLKACPDCRWVFYDHTRNASKRWCLMYAGGPDGRACGTIAKVRRHRQKTSAAPQPGSRTSGQP
jgi:hypothetical protein